MNSLFILSFIFVCLLSNALCLIKPCALREYPNGFVCVCNETYCDEIDVDLPEDDSYVIVSSSKAGQRFEVTRAEANAKLVILDNNPKVPIEDRTNEIKPFTKPEPLGLNLSTLKIVTNLLDEVLLKNGKEERYIWESLSEKEREERNIMLIDSDITYQKMIGFGGAYTGAVTYNVGILSESLRNLFYKSLFTVKEGIGYTMLRISIGGSDFDFEQWAYNEYPRDDIHLSNFTKLDDRDVQRVHQLKEIMNITNSYNIKLLGLSWSPPRWMKEKYIWGDRNALKPIYYQTLADYHVRYLDLMLEQNITFWSLSTGNEPWLGQSGYIKFMNLAWMPANLSKYILKNFVPTMKNSKHKNVKLLIGEDQRFIFPWYFLRILEENNSTLDDIDGFTVHWYCDVWSPTNYIDMTKALFPNKFIINTESSEPRDHTLQRLPVLGLWERGEYYMNGMLEDFSHSIQGWVDWNLALDQLGQPRNQNHSYDATIVINETSKSEFYKQPTYYAMGHVSKFVPEGSLKIDTLVFGTSIIKKAAFLRPDNYIALILLNPTPNSIDITLDDTYKERIIIRIPQKSMHTILYKKLKK